MERVHILEQKRKEMQRLLEQWARDEAILKSGERILFSLRIEAVPLVQHRVRIEKPKPTNDISVIPEVVTQVPLCHDLESMPIQDFLTKERAERAGIRVARHTNTDLTRMAHALQTGFYGKRGSRHIETMGEVLACPAEEIRKRLGPAKFRNALFQAMLKSAGLRLPGE